MRILYRPARVAAAAAVVVAFAACSGAQNARRTFSVTGPSSPQYQAIRRQETLSLCYELREEPHQREQRIIS
jgi:hypothetical protein